MREAIITTETAITEKTTTVSSATQKNVPKVAHHGHALLSKKAKEVQFGKAHFYQHSIIMGDNPACSQGFPLTIDWECTDVVVVDAVPSNNDSMMTPKQQPPHHDIPANQVSFVTRQETSRQSSHSQSRVARISSNKKSNAAYDSEGTDVMDNSMSRLRLSAQERERILRSMGYQRQELIRLCKPVNIARAQRRKTVETLHLEAFQNVLQRTRKFVVSKLFLSPQKRQERQLLREWRRPTSTTTKNLDLVEESTLTAEDCWSVESNRGDNLTEIYSNGSFDLLELEVVLQDPAPGTEQ